MDSLDVSEELERQICAGPARLCTGSLYSTIPCIFASSILPYTCAVSCALSESEAENTIRRSV